MPLIGGFWKGRRSFSRGPYDKDPTTWGFYVEAPGLLKLLNCLSMS